MLHKLEAKQLNKELDKRRKKRISERANFERLRRQHTAQTAQLELLQMKKKREQQEKGDADSSADHYPKPHWQLFHTDTLVSYQYYGDQQFTKNDHYSVSLVSDPVAELYVMSKYDALRKLPQRVMTALFSFDEATSGISDIQLLEMHKQTTRWESYSRALANCGKSYPTAPDVAVKLEFLGKRVNPKTHLKHLTTFTPRIQLTEKEKEHFCDARSNFLRRYQQLKGDEFSSQRRFGSKIDTGGGDDEEPFAARFRKHWSGLQHDPFANDDVDEDAIVQAVIPAETIDSKAQAVEGMATNFVVDAFTVNLTPDSMTVSAAAPAAPLEEPVANSSNTTVRLPDIQLSTPRPRLVQQQQPPAPSAPMGRRTMKLVQAGGLGSLSAREPVKRRPGAQPSALPVIFNQNQKKVLT
jgi:hypothetical protein